VRQGSSSGDRLVVSSAGAVSLNIIGERQDEHMYETEWTDENGRVAPEQLKKNATA